MSENVDLRALFDAWPYDPENDVRMTRGSDGRLILQVRLPLGIEQFELKGRPDGLRPHGKESALDYQLHQLAKAKAKNKVNSFSLDPSECTELFQEGMLYYNRYLHLFQIKDWKRTVRDTARNLRLFDFINEYAQREEDQDYLEQWRPYVLRMHAIASAMIELDNNRYNKANEIIISAIETIESLPDFDDETFKFEQQRSLATLRELTAQIEQNKPLSERELLERELHKAIQAQEFERAAKLRDRIRSLSDKESPQQT